MGDHAMRARSASPAGSAGSPRLRKIDSGTGFVHVLWDDVLVSIAPGVPVARRDPLVAALFGARSLARENCLIAACTGRVG
jgi:hypothetical protein